MRILITGAAGFIGSHLAADLIEDGHEVFGIDNLTTGREINFPKHGHLFIGDIRQALPQDDWDVIYHCAASYKDRGAWEEDASTNVLGTINVVREALRAKAKLVYFQTSLCYGPAEGMVDITSPLAPAGSYAVSKTAGEAYIRDSGVEWVSLRLANMYGPRNLSGPVPTFYQRITEGKPCTIVQARRDFVFVDDLVRLAVLMAHRGRGVYHVSSGRDISIGELYEAVWIAMGSPASAEFTLVPRGADDVATLLLNPNDTYEEFGWRARTPLVTGIRAAVTWYKTHGVKETYTHLAMRG